MVVPTCFLIRFFLLAVFNQKTLYAYKNRTRNVDVDMDVYSRAKESGPEFFCDASSIW
jgi:hypothetical protein